MSLETNTNHPNVGDIRETARAHPDAEFALILNPDVELDARMGAQDHLSLGTGRNSERS